MRVTHGKFNILATDGDRNLGGFDWDNALMRFVNEKFQEQGGANLEEDDAAEADLRGRVEIAKRGLSAMKKANVMVSFQGVSKAIPVTREEFEGLTSELLTRTRDLTETAIQDANLNWDRIDKILLVGGSTRMPMVSAMIESLTGRKAERGIQVDEVVAMGAAIQGSLSATTLPRGHGMSLWLTLMSETRSLSRSECALVWRFPDFVVGVTLDHSLGSALVCRRDRLDGVVSGP